MEEKEVGTLKEDHEVHEYSFENWRHLELCHSEDHIKSVLNVCSRSLLYMALVLYGVRLLQLGPFVDELVLATFITKHGSPQTNHWLGQVAI